MNLSYIFRQYYARIPERTRTLLIALAAFGIGTLVGGSGGATGRYVPVPGPATSGDLFILDTRTGTTWETAPGHPQPYTRLSTFSYF